MAKPEPHGSPGSFRTVGSSVPGWDWEEFHRDEWALVEGADRHDDGPWVVWRDEGAIYEVRTIAQNFGVSEEDVVERLAEDEKQTKDPEIIIGGMEIRPVSLEELDVEPDQGTASRMTIRNLDRTILEVVKARLGADSDAEAVRKALMVAGEVLLED